jgi:hypothetical protein
MFHIFRWRREHRNDNETPSDVSTDQENKKSHLRHHRFRVYHGKQPLERLFHLRKHPSSADHHHHHKQKVISYHFICTYPIKVSDRTCLIQSYVHRKVLIERIDTYLFNDGTIINNSNYF